MLKNEMYFVNKKKAKMFFNVIHEPLLEMPIDQVSYAATRSIDNRITKILVQHLFLKV